MLAYVLKKKSLLKRVSSQNLATRDLVIVAMQIFDVYLVNEVIRQLRGSHIYIKLMTYGMQSEYKDGKPTLHTYVKSMTLRFIVLHDKSPLLHIYVKSMTLRPQKTCK